MKPIPNIELHIEELILHGFPYGDRYQIAKAVERELTRLFAEQAIPASLSRGGEVAFLNAGSFNVAPGSKVEVIGTQVAQSVYGGMNK